MNRDLGMMKVAAASPKLIVANPEYNTVEIISCMKTASENKAAIVCFPELCITGYTCADLFFQNILYKQNLKALQDIAEASKTIPIAAIIGFYLKVENNYYNCGAFVQDGEIKGIVPKTFLPNAKEFYEERWFSSGFEISKSVSSIRLLGKDIPFGNMVFCDDAHDIKVGLEICEDLWAPISPGTLLALNGAHIILNPSASNEMVGKSDYRKALVTQQSAKNICGYVYASSSVYESTTDLVYGGDCIISENGVVLNSSQRFSRDNTIIYSDIDIDRLKFERIQGQTFGACTSIYGFRSRYQHIDISPFIIPTYKDDLSRVYPKTPFVPSAQSSIDERCKEIFNIQSTGLAKRLEHTGTTKVIIGISGGLDSTLALLVCSETFKLLNIKPKNIITVTMPGFGTTNKTYTNAQSLMKLLGTDMQEISIKDSVLQHFKDIDHDPSQHDITYENSQARERTQILMDIANKEKGLVIGTGDLSEVALGWSTYNGDHMSMYGVNVSIPKTLVRFVIEWVMENKYENKMLKRTLQDILDTPISPELLPPDENGEILQKTEETVGPYILHDFFLYYTIRFGMHPQKLLWIAKKTFGNYHSEDKIKDWLILFYRRFFSQQFKRSCIPDGPKVGSVSLSPRGDWRMPSDADVSIWIQELINK